VDAGDDPLSLQAAINSNPKINNVPCAIVHAPIRDKRYIAQSDKCEIAGFSAFEATGLPDCDDRHSALFKQAMRCPPHISTIDHRMRVAERGGQTNGGL
jgi:hypothetical protein